MYADVESGGAAVSSSESVPDGKMGGASPMLIDVAGDGFSFKPFSVRVSSWRVA